METASRPRRGGPPAIAPDRGDAARKPSGCSRSYSTTRRATSRNSAGPEPVGGRAASIRAGLSPSRRRVTGPLRPVLGLSRRVRGAHIPPLPPRPHVPVTIRAADS